MRFLSLVAAILLTVSACSGEDGPAGTDGRSMLLRATDEASGAHCAHGGLRVELGVDDDRDLTLDDGEVDSVVYVCDGAEGRSVVPTLEGPGPNCSEGGVRLTPDAGAATFVCNGAPGESGPAGESVTVTPEASGASCEFGGQMLRVGAGDPAWVCNGAPGADGESVTMTPEPAGASCEFGGVALRVGTGPVTYLCSGAPSGVTLPAVETAEVTDPRYVEAVVSATVTDDGGELILAKGVVLATHAAPTLRDTVFFSGDGSSAFDTRCDGLLPDTTYFVRAFATNALGTSYGDERSFTTRALTVPALTTGAVANVTASTAIVGGTVTDDGGTPILSRGVCWSVAADPTLADACVPEGEGAGTFIALLTGLAAGTDHHVRAYATNAQGTSYGEDRTFTTGVLPLAAVTTSAPSAVSYGTAMGGGAVVSDGGSPVTGRGICWATTPAPTTGDACYGEAGGMGAFTAPITGLAAGTTYFVRAFAVNGGGTSYGNEVTLTTLTPSAPVLSTKPVGGIASYLAGSGGVIASDGGSAITAKGVCWSLNPAPTIANTRTTDGAGPASFNSTLTGLSPLTTYHVRAYATNALGTSYGNELSFTTTDLATPGPTVPVVGTSSSSITGSTTASSGGYVSNDGGSPVTARGVCWGTAQNPTLADTCSADGAGVGFFASTVTGLSGCGVVYYVRAYATNGTGTGYGNQATVSTGLLPVVTTATVTDVGYHTATAGGTIADDGGCPITQKGIAWSWSPTPTSPQTSEGPGGAPFASSLTGLYANRTYYVRAYATNSVGTTYGAQEVFTTAEPSTPYLGQRYAGGIVFHVDGTGMHGLVAAEADQGSFRWGCPGTPVPTGGELGMGATNTAAIVASCGEAGIAARVADDLVLHGYDDWFLPSRDEVSLMYVNLAAQGLGGLGSYTWTSTEAGAHAAIMILSDGWSMGRQKGEAWPVRAVRAF